MNARLLANDREFAWIGPNEKYINNAIRVTFADTIQYFVMSTEQELCKPIVTVLLAASLLYLIARLEMNEWSIPRSEQESSTAGT